MGNVLSFGKPPISTQPERLAFDENVVGNQEVPLPEVDRSQIIDSILQLIVEGGITRDQILKVIETIVEESQTEDGTPALDLEEKERIKKWLLVTYFLKELEQFYVENEFNQQIYRSHFSDFEEKALTIQDILDILLNAPEHELKTRPAYYYAATQYLLKLLESKDDES